MTKAKVTSKPLNLVLANDELVIHFEYAPVAKNTKQDDLNSQAVTAILAHLTLAPWGRGGGR